MKDKLPENESEIFTSKTWLEFRMQDFLDLDYLASNFSTISAPNTVYQTLRIIFSHFGRTPSPQTYL